MRERERRTTLVLVWLYHKHWQLSLWTLLHQVHSGSCGLPRILPELKTLEWHLDRRAALELQTAESVYIRLQCDNLPHRVWSHAQICCTLPQILTHVKWTVPFSWIIFTTLSDRKQWIMKWWSGLCSTSDFNALSSLTSSLQMKITTQLIMIV